MKTLLLFAIFIGLALALCTTTYVVNQLQQEKAAIDDAALTPQQKRIAALVKMLSDENPDDRASTAYKLGGIGKEAVPAILKALKDKNDNVRVGAVWALTSVKPLSKEFIPVLLEAAKDHSVEMRRVAFEALSHFDPTPIQLERALLTELKNSPPMRSTVIVILERLGAEDASTIAALESCLHDQDDMVRWFAARALHKAGPEAKVAYLGLTKVLNDKRIDVVHEAAPCLATISRQHRDKAIAALIVKLKSNEDVDRFAAAEAVGDVGPVAHAAVPTLIELLKDDREIRKNVVMALGRIGPLARLAVPLLLKMLEEKDDLENDTKFEAAWALQRIAPDDEKVFAAVINAASEYAKDSKRPEWRRRDAIYILQRYGKKAHSALPALQKALKSSSPTSRIAAAEAYVKLGGNPKEVIPTLLSDLGKEDVRRDGSFPDTQGDAAEVLGTLGSAAKEAIPPLLKSLNAKEFHLPGRIQVAHALVRIDPTEQTAVAMTALQNLIQDEYQKGAEDAAVALVEFGEKAVPILIEMLKDERRGRRRSAALALGAIGTPAKGALSVLHKAYKDAPVSVRRSVVEACGKIDATSSRQFLLTALNDPAWSVREAAVFSLGRDSFPTKAVIDAIKTMLQDKDVDIQASARETLEKIRKSQ